MMRRVALMGVLASIGAMLLFAATAQAHQGICTETTNPHGQTQIRYFHDWQCYSRFYNLERGGEPLHHVSHDERVESGELLP